MIQIYSEIIVLIKLSYEFIDNKGLWTVLHYIKANLRNL